MSFDDLELAPLKDMGAGGKTCSHIHRLRYLLCYMVLVSLQGTISPSVPYITNTFFAAGHGGGDCEAAPSSDPCRQGAADAAVFHGWSHALANIAAMATAVSLGSCSDRLGRRPLVRAIGTLRVLPYVALAGHITLGLTLWVYLAIYAVVQAVDMNGVLGALMHDAIPEPNEKAAAFGILFVVILMTSGVVVPVGFLMPYGFALAVTLCAAVGKVVYLFAVFPETAPFADSGQKHGGFAETVSLAYRVLTRHTFIFRMCVILAFFGFGTSGYVIVFPLFMTGYMGFRKADNMVLVLVGMSSVLLTFMTSLGPLVARLGEVRVLRASFLAAVAFPLLCMACTEIWHLCALVAILAGPLMLAVPIVISIKGKLVAQDEQGLVQGSMASLSKLMTVLGFGFFSWVVRYSTDHGQVKSHSALHLPFLAIAGFNSVGLVLSCSLPTSLPPAPGVAKPPDKTELPQSDPASTRTPDGASSRIHGSLVGVALE